MKKIILITIILLQSVLAFAQHSVTGRVTDSQGEPLAGVNVMVKGTVTGTITDNEGKYTITASEKDVLVYNFIGFAEQEYTVGNKALINVILEDDMNFLDEAVLVGYGVVKKSDLTSSISSVKGDEILAMPSGNAMNALQGKVNGVQVVTAGSPGASPKVIIRGVTTVNGSDPLYVVDGMPVSGNINFLNNNDIESMEVLKDASAAAIYGTRGSNGVILITTRKGKAGKPKFTFTANTGLQTMASPDMAKAAEYEQVLKARYTNDGREAIWNGKNSADTDWWNEIVNQVAVTQDYQFSVSGGSDKFVYNLSAGYFRQHSQYKIGWYDKFNIRLNTEYKFNKYVTVGMDLSPRMENWEDTPWLFVSAMQMDPTTPVMRPEEEWVDNHYSNYERSHNNESWNPVAALYRQNSSSRDMGILMNPYIQINPIKQLTIRSQYSMNAHFRRSDSFSPKFEIDSAHESAKFSTAARSMSEWLDWNWTNTITYTDTFVDKHNLTALAGFTAERFANYWTTASRDEIPSNNDTLHEVGAGTKNMQSNGSSSFNSLISFLGRVMYNYDSRYYITASIRADGSSKFPAGNKFAIFPSASAAWRFSEESFIKDNAQWFNNGKLRFGWGRVGNQAIDDTATLTYLGTADAVIGGDRVVGVNINSVGNNNLRWETVEDFNIGLDLAFLDNRLEMTADLFQKTSHDMLYKKQNILAVGYPNWNSEIWMNIGSMRAAGWEFSVNWRDRAGDDFNYNVGLNLSSVKNTALKFSGDGPIYTGSYEGSTIIRNEDGGLISRFYGYRTDGIFQNWEEVYSHTDEFGNRIQPGAQPGDLRYKDLNNDGSLNEEDMDFIGNPYPDLMIGLNFGLEWRGLDLSANFYGTVGNEIFNTTKAMYAGKYGCNVFAGAYDMAWRPDNTTAVLPRLTNADINQNYTRVSDFFVEDGSYFRCRQLQLGYTLPSQTMKDVKLRFYLTAQNLFTITKYSGMDPERPQYDGNVITTGVDAVGYPSPRTFLFGINLNF